MKPHDPWKFWISTFKVWSSRSTDDNSPWTPCNQSTFCWHASWYGLLITSTKRTRLLALCEISFWIASSTFRDSSSAALLTFSIACFRRPGKLDKTKNLKRVISPWINIHMVTHHSSISLSMNLLKNKFQTSIKNYPPAEQSARARRSSSVFDKTDVKREADNPATPSPPNVPKACMCNS